jgi:hypothetical protein
MTNVFMIKAMLRNNDQSGYIEYVPDMLAKDPDILELKQMLEASKPYKLNSEAEDVCGLVYAQLKRKEAQLASV